MLALLRFELACSVGRTPKQLTKHSSTQGTCLIGRFEYYRRFKGGEFLRLERRSQDSPETRHPPLQRHGVSCEFFRLRFAICPIMTVLPIESIDDGF
jgi:hypothetical protein